jgi:Dockerin type I domain
MTISGPGIVTYTRRLDVLPGDFYDDGVVNNQDLTAIRNEWKGEHGAQPTLNGEVLGDGTVNASDCRGARKFKGAKLPKLPKT